MDIVLFLAAFSVGTLFFFLGLSESSEGVKRTPFVVAGAIVFIMLSAVIGLGDNVSINTGKNVTEDLIINQINDNVTTHNSTTTEVVNTTPLDSNVQLAIVLMLVMMGIYGFIGSGGILLGENKND